MGLAVLRLSALSLHDDHGGEKKNQFTLGDDDRNGGDISNETYPGVASSLA